MCDCIFCKIVKGEIPNYTIYEDFNTLAFLDISKDYYGHTLVIPKKHYANIFDINETTLNNVLKTVKKVSTHYKNIGFEGINILNNNGDCAGQSVHHFHIHVIPRKHNDGEKVLNTTTEHEYNLEEIKNKLFLKNWHWFIDFLNSFW